MRKMKLDLDSLDVTSFPTDETAESRGTVNAHRLPAAEETYGSACTFAGQYSCDYSCDWTCAASCAGRCVTMATEDCAGCAPA